MTQMVSAERAAALRNKCLNLAKTCRLGSGSASERTSQSRQLMSPIGTFVWTGRAFPQAECDDLEMIGLALLYPALERSVCAPGHRVGYAHQDAANRR